MVSTLGVYLFYLFANKKSSDLVVTAATKEVQHHRFHFFKRSTLKPILLLAVGLSGLLVGANYVIEAIIAVAISLAVPPGFLSISIIALGTSLPELVVSIKSLKADKFSLAIGNIFGSNAFNILIAVGIPGLFAVLPIDTLTYTTGLPMLLLSSFIFLVIGLSRKLYRWEGIAFFLLYIYFIFKLFTLIA